MSSFHIWIYNVSLFDSRHLLHYVILYISFRCIPGSSIAGSLIEYSYVRF